MQTSIFKNKSVLITGGSGSFGQAFAKRLLMEHDCLKVVIFSRDEWKQEEMRQGDPVFRHPNIRYFLGDVRDTSRLKRAFNGIHYIVHAAALKQVPAAEYNPSEFIKTNVIGAMNIIDAALDCGIEKVVALSTDKAVNPVNLYGATKLCSDKLFIAGNAYVGAQGFPQFSVVRYGNVSGSRGSIIPRWKKLVAEGAASLPLTDERMTRFWITLDQAVDLVIKSFAVMQAGEIFVPKIPSIRLTDLAEALLPGVPPTLCGIRSGEKLHEAMISSDDARHTLDCPSYYVIIPEDAMNNEDLLYKFQKIHAGVRVHPTFSYTSEANTQWLSVDTLKQLVK